MEKWWVAQQKPRQIQMKHRQIQMKHSLNPIKRQTKIENGVH
jgi:hypothetical protein